MSWTTPITDRVLADVTNRTSKGFWNTVDWLRIDNNVVYVKTLISVLQSINVTYTDLPDPTVTTIPKAADINDFVENIEALRLASNLPVSAGAVALKTDYTSGESSETPDYEDINAWENNLLVLYTYLIKTATYEVFCGVAEAGQERFWQNRFMTPFIPATLPNIRRFRCGVGICGRGLTQQNGMRGY
jgi:hypothetical protein